MQAKLSILCGLLILSLAATASAGDPKSGYVDFASFGLDSEEEASVEVNLSGPLLKLAAMASEDDEDDPRTAAMLAGLEAITVRVYPMEGRSTESFDAKLAAISKKLEADGWQTIVKVRERKERAHIAIKMDGERVIGLTVVAYEETANDDDDEMVFVNIVGDIDLNEISRLGKHLEIDALDSLDQDDLKTPAKKK